MRVNEVKISGRLRDAPERVRNPTSPQARLTIGHQVNATVCYWIEVSAFDDLATAVLEGWGRTRPLGKGDLIVVEGKLVSYRKPVKGQRGTWHYDRLVVRAAKVDLLESGEQAEQAD